MGDDTVSLEASRIPTMKSVQQALEAYAKELPGGHLYVGPGHHSHRQPTSKWASPWQLDVDCPVDEWLARYVTQIRTNLWGNLAELVGMVLVSDWDNNVNEATALAGLVFDYLSPAAPSPHYKASGKGRASGGGGTTPLRQVMLVGAQALQPSLLFPQESLCLAFKKFYPEEWFRKFQFPMVEDLVNSAPFTTYFDWRQARDLEWDGPLGPVNASKIARLRQRHAEGQQAGALSQKAALPPLISFGLEPDEHFSRCLQVGQIPLPTERMPLLDDDLWFASSVCTTPPEQVKSFRQHAIGALKELKQRWAPVTKHLRALQSPAIRGVTAARDLGLTALLILLSSWADVSYPFGLISGTPAVGTAPNYGIFPAQPGRSITLDEVLEGWESHNSHITRSLKPGLHDETLLEQSLKDADQGFCTPPLTSQELQRITKGRAFRLIPRCIIVQSSGKKRIIDNGDTGGQSALSSDHNKLVLCSPLRPAQHIAMVAASMTWEAWQVRLEHDHFESGGEDWPNAYRHTPISEAESLCCVVCFWNTTWSSPAFQVYHSLLFGLPLTVTSFNRYQDPWYQKQGFTVAKAFFPSELWRLRLADLIRVAEFL